MFHVPKVALRFLVLEQWRSIINAPDKASAFSLFNRMMKSYAKSAPALAIWLELNVPEGLSVVDLPKPHWTKMRTANMSERINHELKRRTRTICIFPNVLLRLVTARLCEISDSWETGKIYPQYESQFPILRRLTDLSSTAQCYRKFVARHKLGRALETRELRVEGEQPFQGSESDGIKNVKIRIQAPNFHVI
jgi:hypothetical protein